VAAPGVPTARTGHDRGVSSPPLSSVIDLSQYRLNAMPDEDSDEDWDDDRELYGPDGRRMETWREGYPYPDRMERREYEIEKRRLQIQLLRLQHWVKGERRKVAILF
jgi:polyphosphate kinase